MKKGPPSWPPAVYVNTGVVHMQVGLHSVVLGDVAMVVFHPAGRVLEDWWQTLQFGARGNGGVDGKSVFLYQVINNLAPGTSPQLYHTNHTLKMSTSSSPPTDYNGQKVIDLVASRHHEAIMHTIGPFDQDRTGYDRLMYGLYVEVVSLQPVYM